MPRGRIESIQRHESIDRQKAVHDMLTSWIKRLPRSTDKVTALCVVFTNPQHPQIIIIIIIIIPLTMFIVLSS